MRALMAITVLCFRLWTGYLKRHYLSMRRISKLIAGELINIYAQLARLAKYVLFIAAAAIGAMAVAVWI